MTSRPAADGSNGLTIGELEANYPLYCKALRRLLQEGRSKTAIQRTVCWERLSQLHLSLPGRYRDPDYLCAVLRRDLATGGIS